MKPYRNLLGLLILGILWLSSCENQIDFQHQNARLTEQLKWEAHQRKALQSYIDYVLNVRYEANAYGTGKRKAWKIKDPVSSDDLLAILKGSVQQVYVPESLEIIEVESVTPAPPKPEELPGSQIIAPMEDIRIEDNLPESTLPGRPLDTTGTPAPGAPVGQLGDLETTTPAARRVGVSRGLPAGGAPARTVVPASGNAPAGDVLLVMEQPRVAIPLEESLLFASGSSNISAVGDRVIAALAKKLRSYPSHLIMVEGHTDGKEVSNLGNIKDNWDLSVMRATEVVRALVRAGVPAQNLIAAGRGPHYPLGSNASAAGRSANRRVEIVLTPWPK